MLEQQGHDVVQMDPEVTWNADDLKEYDVVLVGVSPLTSLSANRVYGALNVINVLLKSDKLRLFIDAPEPTRITTSLRAMMKTPGNMTKPFYSYRKGFAHASKPEVTESLLDLVEFLLSEAWPITLYPSLPWQDKTSVTSQLPEGAQNSLVGINLDSYLLSNQDALEVERRDKWVVDSFSTAWIKSTISTLENPTVPMKWNKGWTDDQVFDQITRGIGALVTPHLVGGTWWSYRMIQCMNACTPIATEWKESGSLGDEWMYLASRIESLSTEERVALAAKQRELYANAVPSRRDAAVHLIDALGLYKKKEK